MPMLAKPKALEQDSALIRNKIEKRIAEAMPFFSFEYFPPKTDAGMLNLYERLDRMAGLEPLFIDITWGAGGKTKDKTLEFSLTAQKYFGLDVMMHLTCTNIARPEIECAVKQAIEGGVRNILALRGDPPHGSTRWSETKGGFAHASDLTTHLRANYGQDISIAVAGYPEGHQESPDLDTDVAFMKTKVEAGADFIVTQLFYDCQSYFDFVERCRKAGITCPIIPGIMPIQTYDRFIKFTKFGGIQVPEHIHRELEPIRSDDAKVQHYGIDLGTKMCQELLEGGAPGVHFYTLNLETSVREILCQLGMSDNARQRRAYPWRSSSMGNRRADEDVRPIYWSNRPKSYLDRTASWDDFPNGRWGNSKSPTFGELSEYYLFSEPSLHGEYQKRVLDKWGTPENLEDVKSVFLRFCRGEIDQLPWSEMPIQAETALISSPIVELIEQGFLTINSQPQLNGVASEDPQVGWGGQGGYIYQKAYLEFFMPAEKRDWLIQQLSEQPTVSYQITSLAGELITNVDRSSVNAVTWGVWPGSEILQPTVVDASSFLAWRDEAFELWTSRWAALYPSASRSFELLKNIHDTFYLVNIVENDYQNGDIFKLFKNGS